MAFSVPLFKFSIYYFYLEGAQAESSIALYYLRLTRACNIETDFNVFLFYLLTMAAISFQKR